jgi:hypothetical protein
MSLVSLGEAMLTPVLDAIDAAARQLLQGPLPRGHFAPLTGERLQTAVLNIKQRWRSI